ncbi:MAG: hypothetical protein NVSMB6_24920 [Burkholderiaceae bacterium]
MNMICDEVQAPGPAIQLRSYVLSVTVRQKDVVVRRDDLRSRLYWTSGSQGSAWTASRRLYEEV